MTKLTFEEYQKACDAGLITGHACACYGKAKEEDDYCGCIMSTMEKLTEDGQIKYKAELKANGRLSYSELDDMYNGPPPNPLREKRLQKMKALGYNTDGL